MPIPKPRKGEERNAYISRCARFLINEGTEKKKAIAICFSEWRKKE